jgi:hypothetical protein
MLSSVGYLSDGTWQRPRLGDVVALVRGRTARAAKRGDRMLERAIGVDEQRDGTKGVVNWSVATGLQD